MNEPEKVYEFEIMGKGVLHIKECINELYDLQTIKIQDGIYEGYYKPVQGNEREFIALRILENDEYSFTVLGTVERLCNLNQHLKSKGSKRPKY